MAGIGFKIDCHEPDAPIDEQEQRICDDIVAQLAADAFAEEWRAAVDRAASPTEPADEPEPVAATDAPADGETPMGGAAAGDASHLAPFDPVALGNIPAELKAAPRWVGYQMMLKPDKDKPTKVPVDVRGNIKIPASWSDKKVWSDFETVARLARVRGLDGIGFIFGEDAPFTAGDLDNVFDDEGNLRPHVVEILSYKETYAEWSPSGKGIHFITSLKIDGQRVNHNAGVEMYGNRRFMTVTGRLIDDAPSGIHEAPKTVKLLTARVDEFDAIDAAEEAQAGHGDAPKDNLDEAGASNSSSPWRVVNDTAIRNYDKWVSAIFPKVKKLNSGILRVESRYRGRPDLQEDISFAPGGIKDFGLEGGRTAIDIVQEFLPAKDAVDAARWLCNKLSLDPKSLGFRWADNKSSKKHHRKAEPQHDIETGEIIDDNDSNAADDASHEDAAPELDEANEKIIAEMVRRHRSVFEVTHRDASLEDIEADSIAFEEMFRRAVYDRVLDADFKLFVEGEHHLRPATVGEIVADTEKRFTGKKVRDPLGVASKFVGRLSLERGAPRITMFDKSSPFYLIDKPPKGGDQSERDDDAWQGHGGVSLDDFYAYMPMHRYIYTPTRALWPSSSVDSRIPPVKLTDKNGEPLVDAKGKQKTIPASFWLDKHHPIQQMIWSPAEPMIVRDRLMLDGGWIDKKGASCFNQYQPPTIKRGNAADVGLWLDHIHNVYGDDADHTIRWFAHRAQRPQEKINHALVLGGPQGVGKDTMLEPVKRTVAPWNFQEVSPAQAMGRFNSFLKSVILRISEVRDFGDTDRYKFYDHMKAYTAAPPDVLRVDEKHLHEQSVLNCCGVIITTNYKTDGIYLSPDDRRHFVAWTELTKEDFSDEYWSVLWSWYESGGFENVAAYLAELDLSSFNAKAPPPKTQAFWDIVDAHRAPEDGELSDVIESIGSPRALTIGKLIVSARGDLIEWLKDRRNSRIIPHRLEACGYTRVRNDTAKDGQWTISGKRQAIYAKKDIPQRERLAAACELCG